MIRETGCWEIQLNSYKTLIAERFVWNVWGIQCKMPDIWCSQVTLGILASIMSAILETGSQRKKHLQTHLKQWWHKIEVNAMNGNRCSFRPVSSSKTCILFGKNPTKCKRCAPNFVVIIRYKKIWYNINVTQLTAWWYLTQLRLMIYFTFNCTSAGRTSDSMTAPAYRLTFASVAQLDAPSDWRPGGRGFNPRRGRQHSFVEIDHEIFSTVILSLPLIQEGQLSVSGERMCTILVNRLED